MDSATEYNKSNEKPGKYTPKHEYKKAFSSKHSMDIVVQYDDIQLKRIVIEIIVYIVFLIIISIGKHRFQANVFFYKTRS